MANSPQKRTIVALLDQAAEKFENLHYASHKIDGGWKSYTYREIRDNVNALAAALLHIGFKKGHHAAILSEGSPQWIMAEMALLCIRASSVPLSVKLLPEELPFRLDHSDAMAVFTSKNNLPKILKIYSDLNNKNLRIIYLDEDEKHFFELLEKNKVPCKQGFTLNALLKDGRIRYNKNPEEIDRIKASVEEDDLVNISYTSGTTGNPKGIMLSHLNYYSNAKDGTSVFKLKKGFRTLVILPVDHSFAHTVALYGALFVALDLYFLDTRGGVTQALKNIPINLKEIKPQFLLTVPALSGKFMNKMLEGINEKGGVIAKMFHKGLQTALAQNGDGFTKDKAAGNFLGKLSLWASQKLIFTKLRDVFGGELQYMVGGGALLDIKQQQFYYAIGIPVFQGYGQSEAAPIISSNTPFDHKLGTSGKLMPGVTCRIMKDKKTEAAVNERGEIVVKGDNVMLGYYKNEKATRETVVDNWLWTGDLGFMDQNGYLLVTGRNKALLISEDGEKYSPEEIEEAMVNNSELIGQTVVYNNQNKFTTAVVTIDPLKIHRLRNKRPLEVLEEVKQEFRAFRKDPAYKGKFPGKWVPDHFYIAPEPFTEDNKMVNSTMKLVRHKIVSEYKNEINEIYQPGGTKKIETENLASIQKIMGKKE